MNRLAQAFWPAQCRLHLLLQRWRTIVPLHLILSGPASGSTDLTCPTRMRSAILRSHVNSCATINVRSWDGIVRERTSLLPRRMPLLN
jgi:hypothetical protein